MAAPTFDFAEKNGAGASLTSNIPKFAFASTDAASTNVLSVNNPIQQGDYSYEKNFYLEVTGAAPNSISGLSFFFSSTTVKDSGGSAANVPIKYYANANPSYTTPVNTVSAVATTDYTTNTSNPGQDMTAPANSIAALSSAIVLQLRFGASAAGGDATFPSDFNNVAYTYA